MGSRVAPPPPPRTTAPRATEARPPEVKSPRPPEVSAPAAPVAAPPKASVPAEAAFRAELVAHCRAELERSPEPERAGRLYAELAAAFEAEGDLPAAAEHYRHSRALLPGHVPALRGARRVALATGDLPTALDTLEAEGKALRKPADRARLAAERGRLLEEKVLDRARAREAFAEVIGLEPRNVGALEALARLDRAQANWDELSRAEELHASAVSADPRLAAAILEADARVAEKQRKDVARAIELHRSAFELDPAAFGPFSALERLLGAERRWRDLAAVLGKRAEVVEQAHERTRLHTAVARLSSERLGDEGAALDSLERALSDSPHDQDLLARLARGYERAGRFTDLARTLALGFERGATLAARLSAATRLGEVHETELGDEDGARQWYRRALELDGAHAAAHGALVALLERRSDWAGQCAALESYAASAGDAQIRGTTLTRLGEVYERRLGDVDRAIAAHARALLLLPGHPPSFQALSRLYAGLGRQRELIALYEQAVDAAPDVETQVAYLLRIGQWLEESLGVPAHAIATYRRVLDLDAKNLVAVHAWQRAAERAGNWAELVAALEREADMASDGARRSALLVRAAEVLLRRASDLEGAVGRCQRVLAVDARHGPALDALADALFALGRWDELAATWRRKVEISGRSPEAVALLFRIGELHRHRTGSRDEALRAWREALAQDPLHGPTLAALGLELEQSSDVGELSKLLTLEVTRATEPLARGRSALRLARVHDELGQDATRALSALEPALAVPELADEARGLRARLLDRLGQHARLVELLVADSAEIGDDARAAALLTRAAEVARDDLGDATRTVELLEAAMLRDPGCLPALLGLEAQFSGASRWADLARVLEALARATSDAVERAAVERRLARLIEARGLGGASEAARAWTRVLELLPSDVEALGELERLARALGDHALGARVDAQLGALLDDAPLAARHHTRLAELLEAASDPSAVEVYRSALARDPHAIAAALGFARAARARGDSALLEEAAGHALRALADRRRAATLYTEGAERARADGARERAVTLLRRALELDPDEPRAAELLIGDWLGEPQALADVLADAARACRTRERGAAIGTLLARHQADGLADVRAAIVTMNRVAQQVPGEIAPMVELARLYARAGEWSVAVDRWAQVLQRSPQPDVGSLAYLEQAKILDARLGDAQRALAALDAALALDPRRREALAHKLDLELRVGRAEPAALTAERLLEVAESADERASASIAIGKVAAARGERERAFVHFAEAVALVGGTGAVLSELRALLDDEDSWGRYAAALSRFVEGAAAAHPAYAATALELSIALGDHLSAPDRALAPLTKALAQGDDARLRRELGARLLQAGHAERALPELRRVLELDPLDAIAWRALSAALQKLGRAEDASLALAPLVALGLGSDAERAEVAARPPVVARGRPGGFNHNVLRGIDVLGGADPACAVLAAISDGLGKLYPADLDRYGLTARDRIGARAVHPVRALADRVAQLFGDVPFDLFVHRAHAGSIEVELGDPPWLMVPASVAALPEPQLVFLLARAIASIARQLHAVDRLPPRGVELAVLSAVRTAVPGFGTGAADAVALDEEARRLGNALPRRSKKLLEEALPLVPATLRMDWTRWASGVRQTSSRAALLIADDLPGTVLLLRRTEGDLAGVQGEALAHALAAIHDLNRFWVSDAAFALRRRL